MLILGRRPGESIVIDGGITIVVLACEKGGVRLGIEAPADVSILRGEIVRQVADENRRAEVASHGPARAVLESLGVAPAPGAVPDGSPDGEPDRPQTDAGREGTPPASDTGTSGG